MSLRTSILSVRSLARVVVLPIVLLSLAIVHAVTAVAHTSSSAAVLRAAVNGPPAKYARMGCGTTQLYVDTTPGQDFLCGNAPGKTFKAGPNDIVFAGGANAKIFANNRAPNQIHGVASDTARIDSGINDCPVYGTTKLTPANACKNFAPVERADESTPPTTTTTTAAPAKAAACVPPNSNIETYGWRPQLLDICHFTIPPDIKCQVLGSQRIVVLTNTPQIAAQDANPGVVDWQVVAWSMVIYKRASAGSAWQAFRQTPWYWDEPTDLFDAPLSAVQNNWRRFGSKVDGFPAYIVNQPLFMPSAGQYKFQILEQWYPAPAPRPGLKPLQLTYAGVDRGFYLTPFHVSARWGAAEVPTSPNSAPDAQQFQAAACQFS